MTFKEWCRFLDILCGGKSRELQERRASLRAWRGRVRRQWATCSAREVGECDMRWHERCSSRRRERKKNWGRGEQNVGPAEDVEDAILASLELMQRTGVGPN